MNDLMRTTSLVGMSVILALALPEALATEPAATADAHACPATERGRLETWLLPPGYLHTAGSQIVDEAGVPVRIASVGWNQAFDNPDAILPKIARAGFNAVRVSWVDATMQSDLKTIDAIVAAAGRSGVKVILDHHTNEAGTAADGWGAQQKNGLWYDSGPGTDGTNGAGVKGTVTQATFQAHWVEVAKRYTGNSTVIGFDLDNEPLVIRGGATWGSGGLTDIRVMYQTVGNAILAVNPGALIIAEGPQDYSTEKPWGDLSKVRRAPVELAVPNKVVYSVHDYPRYISDVREDSGPRKVAQMNRAWGYLVSENIAPVWIGEMGANFDGSWGQEHVAGSRAWASTLVNYLNGKLGDLGGPRFTESQQGISTNWWAWGHLAGQSNNGTLAVDGSLRREQYEVYHQLQPIAACGTDSRSAPVR
jgi:endoglucanase